MFPIGDDNPTRRPPVITTTLLIANILVFLLQITGGDGFIIRWSFIPLRLTAWLNGAADISVVFTVFTAMFMHASIGHIGGNLLFLWIFGDNVEDEFGRLLYLVFYLLCGIVATLAQYFTDPFSRIPNLGASGAISGVLGAYVIMHPLARVRLFFWPFSLFIGTLPIPAFLWIGFWFFLQLVSGFQSLGMIMDQGGVAFWAHIGGFVSGLVLVWVFRRLSRRPPRPYISRRY